MERRRGLTFILICAHKTSWTHERRRFIWWGIIMKLTWKIISGDIGIWTEASEHPIGILTDIPVFSSSSQVIITLIKC